MENKWPVKTIAISILVLVFMVLFKNQIAQILTRMTSLEVSRGENGISVKINTPLGETVVSNAPANTKDSEAKGFKQETRNAYRISWPQNGKWSQNKEIAAQFGADLVVSYFQNIGNFNPNINVVLDRSAGGADIDEYLKKNQEALRNMGWEIVTSESAPATRSGVQVIRNKNMNGGLYQIQKVILKDGVAYVATASKLEGYAQEAGDLDNDTREILNSFVVM